ncbi:MAG: carbohydrate kinase family protein [Anaerolineaceae bacterium]|nr:carbohydrate kinase family protein [Anaerolineaceae bacterium]
MNHVVAVGDLVVDMVMPVRLPVLPFQHQETHGAYLEAGGGCNFNIMARRLGLGVLAVGAIGADIFGDELRRILTGEGVDLRGAVTLPGSQTCVVYDLIDHTTHEHVFIGSLAAGDPVAYTPELDGLAQTGDAVFLQGYNLHEVQLPALIDGVLARARESRIPVFCDSGPTIRNMDFARVEALLSRCDVLMMTEEEVPFAANGRAGEDAYAFLFGLGAAALVVKQGAAGCTVIQPETRVAVPGFPVKVVDTVGAGDCFNAGLVYGRTQGWDWREAAQLANACGAAAVRKVGSGRNAPTRAEVEAVLRDNGVSLPGFG